MTQKEILNVIKTEMSANADVVNFCDKMLVALDKKNEKARERAAAKRVDDPITNAILGVLTSSPQTLAEIAAQIPDSTPNKVSARIGSFVDDGTVTKTVARDGKKRTTVYSLA